MIKSNRFVQAELLKVLIVGFFSGAIIINIGIYIYDFFNRSETIELFPLGSIFAALFTYIVLRLVLRKIKIPHFGLIASFGFFLLLSTSGFSDTIGMRYMWVDLVFFLKVIKTAIIQGIFVAVGLGIFYTAFNNKYFKR